MRRSLSRLAIPMLLAALVAGCAVPTPTASPQPSPAAVLPEPSCEPAPDDGWVGLGGATLPPVPVLECGEAVRAAAELLDPDVLPSISGVEFHYGRLCLGLQCPLAVTMANSGYVVFWTASRGSQSGYYVNVRKTSSNEVQATSDVRPYSSAPYPA